MIERATMKVRQLRSDKSLQHDIVGRGELKQ